MFYNCIAASCGTFIPAAPTAAAAILVVAVVFVVNFIVIALIVVLVITVACHEMLLAVARRIALPTIASQSVSPQWWLSLHCCCYCFRSALNGNRLISGLFLFSCFLVFAVTHSVLGLSARVCVRDTSS